MRIIEHIYLLQKADATQLESNSSWNAHQAEIRTSPLIAFYLLGDFPLMVKKVELAIVIFTSTYD